VSRIDCERHQAFPSSLLPSEKVDGSLSAQMSALPPFSLQPFSLQPRSLQPLSPTALPFVSYVLASSTPVSPARLALSCSQAALADHHHPLPLIVFGLNLLLVTTHAVESHELSIHQLVCMIKGFGVRTIAHGCQYSFEGWTFLRRGVSYEHLSSQWHSGSKPA
jgi:hypothetical protein